MTGQSWPEAAARTGRSHVDWVTGPAAVLLVIAVPVAIWWLTGDLSTAAGNRLDYLVRPPDIAPGTERTAGIVATVVGVVALLTLVAATAGHRLRWRWWGVVAPLVAAGAVLGWGWRVVTAGVIGANFGGGFVLMVGGAAIAALLAGSVVQWLRLHHRDRVGPTPAHL